MEVGDSERRRVGALGLGPAGAEPLLTEQQIEHVGQDGRVAHVVRDALDEEEREDLHLVPGGVDLLLPGEVLPDCVAHLIAPNSGAVDPALLPNEDAVSVLEDDAIGLALEAVDE